jgi:Uma2 family endonuclease
MVELSLGLRTVDLPFMVWVPDVTDEMFDELVDEDTKAELIDGVMIVHSPASMHHDQVNDFFRTMARLFVKRRKLGSVFGSDSLVRLAPRRRFAPDMYFLSRGRLPPGRPPKEFNGVPELIGEVLSPSNRRHDLEVKRPAYRSAGVQEIWLIDPQKERVTVDRRRGQRYTTTTRREGRIESKVIPGFWIDVSWLWEDELPDELDCLGEILGENTD